MQLHRDDGVAPALCDVSGAVQALACRVHVDSHFGRRARDAVLIVEIRKQRGLEPSAAMGIAC